MSDAIQFRSATGADAPALTALARRAKASWGYPPAWLAAWEGDLTLTPDYLEYHRAFVAEREGQVVGVVVLEEHPARWSLEHVWVDPDAQGRGTGRALVEHALAVAVAYRQGPVEVVSDHFAGPFYERLGAVRVGAQPAPMPEADDRMLPILEFRFPPEPTEDR
jgi:predicted N-acetyltransferase YhbS